MTDEFSPRKVAEQFVLEGKLRNDQGLWQCMGCGACTETCQNEVRFHEYLQEKRRLLRKTFEPEDTHGSAPGSMMRLTANENVCTRKERWVTPDLKLDRDSETLLFVGCTPYFDVMFRYLRDDLLEIPRSAVRLLNTAGIKPRLLSGERCCGHDAFWLGDEDLFDRLARLNLDAIEKAGIKEVVAFCPECYSTLKDIYPRRFGPLGFKVRSVAEVVSEKLKEGELELRHEEEKLTYHDPCRLGRHARVFQAPRDVLSACGDLVEMPRNREMSACCGNAAFVNCNGSTRLWQLDRLKEARETGTSALVTACPKCLIHLSCAGMDNVQIIERKKLPIVDLHVLAASRIKG
jgi:Fe-S oxidoreductase